MKVRATKVTFSGGRAQNPGDIFEVDPDRGFNPNVMEKVAGKADVTRPITKRAAVDPLPPSGTGEEEKQVNVLEKDRFFSAKVETAEPKPRSKGRSKK